MVLVKTSRERGPGSGGGLQVGGFDEGKVCSVAWQRQHVHHQQHSTRAGVKMAAQVGESLPVVELRPFTKRVWRREKSLPNFSEQPSLKGDSGTDSSRDGGIPAPPNIGQFIKELREQRRAKDPSRHSVDSDHRLRLKLHPKADFSFDGDVLAGHRQDLIPSFVSRHDRSKSTLGEDGGVPTAAGSATAGVSNGSGEETAERSGGPGTGPPEGLVRESSNLMTAFTRDKPLHNQNLCLMGDKIPVTHPGRRHLAYLNPYPQHRQRQAWNSMRLENSPTALSPRQRVNVSFLARDGRTFPLSKDHPAAQDLVLSGSFFHATGRPLPYSTKHRHPGPHTFNQKLGAAQDSFLMLSRTGAPTVLEQNLSFDHEVRLDRCRRERSFAALSHIGDVNSVSPAHYLSYDSHPTPGEAVLMKAREANKSQDRHRAVHRKNGLDRSLVTLPTFTHHPLGLFQGRLEDTPTSNKSEHGSSDTSSPGEPVTDSTRLMDVTGSVAQNATPTAQQQSQHSATRKDSAKGLYPAVSQAPAPVDNMALLQADLDSLVDSTDEYQHPLSDTAATETVHVRNDQTPMSADNRARLLPSYNAYLEVIQTGREHRPQRQRVESHADDATLSKDAVLDGDAQQARRAESGAKTANPEANTRNAGILSQSISPSTVGSPGALENESDKKETQQKALTPAGSAGAKTSTSDSTDSVQLAEDVPGVDSRQSQLAQRNTNRQLSPQTDEHDTKNPHSSELLSVRSSVSSSVDLDGRPDPDKPCQSPGYLVQENLADAKRSGLSDSPKMLGVNEDCANGSITSNGTVNSAGSKEGKMLHHDQQDKMSEPESQDKLSERRIPASEDSTHTEQDGTQDRRSNGNVATDNEGLSSTLLVKEDKIANSKQNDGSIEEQAKAESSDVNARITHAHKIDETVAGNTPQRDGLTEEHAASSQKASQKVNIETASSADSLRPSSQSAKSQTSDKPASTENHVMSEVKSENGIHENAEEKSEDGVESGVETMVTVTMDVAECDNIDDSKTFLTTANVDSGDWQDIIAA